MSASTDTILPTIRGARGGWRWLLLLVFVAGALPGVSVLAAEYPSVRVLNGVCLLACAVLLHQLRRPVRHVLWAWVMLLVFLLGYFVKMIVFASAVTLPEFLTMTSDLLWLTRGDIAAGFPVITAGFVVFCLTAAVVIRLSPPMPRVAPAEVSQFKLENVMLFTLGAGVVTSVLPLMLGFGQMGVVGTGLPFHLDLVITRTRLNLVPAVFVLTLWLSEKPRRRRDAVLTLGLLLFVGLLDAVVRASRGSLVLYCLPAFFLWLVTDRLTRGKKMIGAALAMLVLLMYPVTTLYRRQMMNGLSPAEALAQAAALSASADSRELLRVAFLNLSTRVSGADGVWQAMAYRRYAGITAVPPAQMAPKVLSNAAWSGWYTAQVARVTTPGDFRPPTLVGGFLLLGGPAGMVVLVALYTLAAGMAWAWIGRLSVGPPGLAVFGAMLMMFTSEAPLGVQEPVALLATLWVLSWVYRRVRVSPNPETPPVQPAPPIARPAPA